MTRRSLYALACALAMSSNAAAAVCDRMEFAEMDAMRREELLALRCEYKTSLYESIGRANETAKSHGIYAAAPYMAAMDRCSSELDRMDRILVRKYGLTGDKDELLRQVTALCWTPPPGR